MCGNCHVADVIIFSMGHVHYNANHSKSKVYKSGFNQIIFQYNQFLNPNSFLIQGVFPFNQFSNPSNFSIQSIF
jgi:hypothetical protein